MGDDGNRPVERAAKAAKAAAAKAIKDAGATGDPRSIALSALTTMINKVHGVGTVGVGSSMRPQVLPRIPTGSLGLDFGLGGGIPVGRCTLVYGGESSGKSTLVQRIMGKAQRRCRHCYRPVPDWHVVQTVEEAFDKETGELLVPAQWEARGTCDCVRTNLVRLRPWHEEDEKAFHRRVERLRENSYEALRAAMVDPEGTFDWQWAQRVGLDPRLLLYVCPTSMEDAVDIYDAVLRTAAIDVIALDSIAALTPDIEIEESSEKDQRAAAAKLANKLVRKVTSSTNAIYKSHGVLATQLWVNQVRKGMDGGWGDQDVLPAGNGQGFLASVKIKLWPSKWEKEEVSDDGKKDDLITIGTRVRQNYLVKKNKTSAAQASGSYPLITAGPDAGQIDDEGFALDVAERFGFWAHDKKWTYCPDPRKPQQVETFATKAALLAHLREPVRWEQMRAQLLRCMLDQVARGDATLSIPEAAP